MDDKMIMENLLNTTKGVCDLYMHLSLIHILTLPTICSV